MYRDARIILFRFLRIHIHHLFDGKYIIFILKFHDPTVTDKLTLQPPVTDLFRLAEIL